MTGNLLTVSDLGRDGLDEILRLAEVFEEVSARPIPKVPALRGKTVATLFYEDSTRTRLSFDAAAKRLSADVMTFSAATSSAKKGESLRDTVETLDAMGVDAFVVRHSSSGAAHRVAGWTDAAVVNAGDGWHEHPTQALLDCFTILKWRGDGDAPKRVRDTETGADPTVEEGGRRDVTEPESSPGSSMEGLHIVLVGDVAHSRVARSNVSAFSMLGARVTVACPPTMAPPEPAAWPASFTGDLDSVLPSADVVYLLRIQAERTREALVPSLTEYTARWGLTRRRADVLRPGTIVLHPGPMNRGVEIASEVADLPAARVVDQVRNGVAVRMAVLYRLLGGGSL